MKNSQMHLSLTKQQLKMVNEIVQQDLNWNYLHFGKLPTTKEIQNVVKIAQRLVKEVTNTNDSCRSTKECRRIVPKIQEDGRFRNVSVVSRCSGI